MSAVSARNIVKQFGAVPAVNGISLEVPNGEFMVLLGLNLVSTLLPPNAVHAGPFYMKKAEMLCLLVHFKLQLTNLRCGVKYLADAARDALNCLFSGH